MNKIITMNKGALTQNQIAGISSAVSGRYRCGLMTEWNGNEFTVFTNGGRDAVEYFLSLLSYFVEGNLQEFGPSVCQN